MGKAGMLRGTKADAGPPTRGIERRLQRGHHQGARTLRVDACTHSERLGRQTHASLLGFPPPHTLDEYWAAGPPRREACGTLLPVADVPSIRRLKWERPSTQAGLPAPAGGRFTGIGSKGLRRERA